MPYKELSTQHGGTHELLVLYLTFLASISGFWIHQNILHTTYVAPPIDQ